MTMPENMSGTDDHAGVIMKPPKIFAATAALALVMGLWWPLPLIAPYNAQALIAGLILLAAGIVLMGICVRRFSASNTNIPTDRPTNALVTNGPYAYSRNPIYLSMMAIYLALGLMVNSFWFLFLLVPLWLVMRWGVIAREERYLNTRFGEVYRDYRRKVRRWI